MYNVEEVYEPGGVLVEGGSYIGGGGHASLVFIMGDTGGKSFFFVCQWLKPKI